jgi:hypothetical protein
MVTGDMTGIDAPQAPTPADWPAAEETGEEEPQPPSSRQAASASIALRAHRRALEPSAIIGCP